MLVQQITEIIPSIRECWIDARRGSQCRFGFDIATIGSEHIAEIERCRRIRWIALHQNEVETLGLRDVSILLSRLCLLKQVIGIVLRCIDREHKLAMFVGASPRLLDFETVVGASMEPHVGQANFRQPFPDLTNGTSDFGQSNSVPKQLRDLTSTRQIAEAETATLLI